MLETFIPSSMLEMSFYGNSVQMYIQAGIIVLGSLLVFYVLKVLLLARIREYAKNTKNDFDDALVDILSELRFRFLAYVSFYVGSLWLSLPEFLSKALYILLLILAVVYVTRAVISLVSYAITKGLSNPKKQNENTVRTLNAFLKYVIWFVAILLVISNLGFNITSLVTGLGIGGIAVALAVQNILGDIFSSFSIYFDRPFEVGDFIAIGKDKGTVKKIGIKSTRLKTLKGDELVISNRELTTARIQNYKKLKKRRVEFTLGVKYETPIKKLKWILEAMPDMVGNSEKVNFERVALKHLGDYAIQYEVVYYIDSSDYADYVNEQQRINFHILEEFEKQGIGLAYPTQEVVIRKE